jgi:N-acylglucosamine 2-epimerase
MMPDALPFAGLLSFYRDHLYRQVMPFWLRHGIDHQFGGVFNYLRDDGSLLSADKAIWSQARALWTFSALWNAERSGPWLEIAHRIAGFLLRHARDDNGAWVFRVSREGRVLDPPQSIYVDAFAIYGLTEYARATGDQQALDAALDGFHRTSPLLHDHSALPTRPHPIPSGLQSHGPSMIFALVYHELGLVSRRPDILGRALELAGVVMTRHLDSGRRVLFEFVPPGGGFDDSAAGLTVIPGHAVESMWFMERIYRHHGDSARAALALEAIRWHLELGWDNEYGGLFLARRVDGGPPVWHSPDAKVWWTVAEALYALLRAYAVLRGNWCLEWHQRVHEYAFRAHPNREHGDWFQNLDRQGRPVPAVVASLPVKDPFHLPRALLYSIETLRSLAGESKQGD